MEHWIFRMVGGDASSDLAKFVDGGKARTIFDVIAKDSTTPHDNHLFLISPNGEVAGRILATYSKQAR